MPDKATSLFDLFVSIVTSKTAIASAIGFVSGAALTLFTPWNKWIIEKRKLKLENRKEKIRKWREEIGRHATFVEFSQTSTFQDLKGHLTKDEIRGLYVLWLDKNPNINSEKTKLMRFHEIVSQYEKEWKII